MGIPAIVPDTCAAREQVVDCVTGLWFRGGNSDDLQQKMEYLGRILPLRARWGERPTEGIGNHPQHSTPTVKGSNRYISLFCPQVCRERLPLRRLVSHA